MQIDMTANGVGSAVHELMRGGMPLEDALGSVGDSLRKRGDEFLASDLVDFLVRRAEQDVWHRHRPLATNGAEEGQFGPESHASTAPSGAHKQPWTFCIISNSVLKSKIRELAEEEEKIIFAVDQKAKQ